MAFINNVLVQLFDAIESNSGVSFATFTTNETTKEENIINRNQKFMEDYENTFDNKIYKYLYDPDLSFDFRFHQRLASISYEDKKSAWVTLMFNTGPVRPLTGVLSRPYNGYEQDGSEVYPFKIKRVSVPINMVFISNDLTYLYSVTEKVAFYFDRLINFPYREAVQYSDTYTETYENYGMAKNIQQIDLTKLDTSSRGTLVTTAFTFDLIYFVVEAPNAPTGLLEKIIVEIKVKGHNESLFLNITE